jgi:pimeloyl-ACP methyl ester carboxylesterase
VRVDEHTTELDGEPVFHRTATAEAETGPARAVPERPAPVLYLHSAPTSSDDWLPFLIRTGGLAPDLPGFGRSGKGGHLDYSLEGMADFVQRFLDERGVRRVRLVGHGWGAAIGLVLAQRSPQLVARLVLFDPVPLLQGFRWPRLVRVWRRPLLGELAMGVTSRAVLTRALRHGAVRAEAWPDDRVAAVWDQFDQGTQRAILLLHRAADEERLAAAGAGLVGLRAPALIVWGERDPWLAAGLADAYGVRLPNATVQRVPDAGHWPWLDDPALLDRIAGFLG